VDAVRGEATDTNAIREQQLKWMQSESSSLIGRSRGEATDTDAIREQQLRWMQ